MNKTQRIILILLVLAILFSAVSIFVSIGAFYDAELPERSVSGNVIADTGGPGGIELTIEKSPERNEG